MVGDLLRSTFDAPGARSGGRPAMGSSIWPELGVLLGGIVFVPESLLRRSFALGRSSLQPV